MKKWALYLGKFFGIQIYIHWTFLILIGWIFIMNFGLGRSFEQALASVLFILALFACVVLHEFGHALTAKRFHVNTRDITLYPIGGIASLESMPENPRQELLVAIAGPMVNIAIALVLWLYLFYSGFVPDWEQVKNQAYLDHLPFAFKLLTANIILATFNMIPAFPMDGGRVLRALLAFKMGRSKATRLAASIGQLLAITFVFLGFFYNFWLVFIGLFVFLGAGGEAAFESTRDVLSHYQVRDAMMTKFNILSTQDSLEKAVHLLLEGQDKEFLVAENGKVEGVLLRRDLIHGLAKYGKSSPVAGVMQTDYMSLTPELPLKEIYTSLMSAKCPVSPVIENGKLIGMLDKESIQELIWVNEVMTQDRY